METRPTVERSGLLYFDSRAALPPSSFFGAANLRYVRDDEIATHARPSAPEQTARAWLKAIPAVSASSTGRRTTPRSALRPAPRAAR